MSLFNTLTNDQTHNSSKAFYRLTPELMDLIMRLIRCSCEKQTFLESCKFASTELSGHKASEAIAKESLKTAQAIHDTAQRAVADHASKTAVKTAARTQALADLSQKEETACRDVERWGAAAEMAMSFKRAEEVHAASWNEKILHFLHEKQLQHKS